MRSERLRGGFAVLFLALLNPALRAQDYVITQAPLGFTSISSNAVNHGLSFSDKDDGHLNIAVPFNFQFFGSNIVAGSNMLRLGANGAVSFQTTVNIGFTSSDLSSAPNNTIFLAWDDLNFTTSGSIFTALQGTAPNRVWIIEYRMVPPFSAGGTFLDGQIAIFETSNIIEFRYSAATVFGSGTVASGLKSSTGLARGFPGITRGQPTPTSNLVFSPASPIDLALSNFVVNTPMAPGQVTVGDIITISVDINNLVPLGNSTSFPVNVYLSPDSTIDTNDQLIGSFGSGLQLNAGTMANLSQSFTVPNPNVTIPSGNYVIGLIADPANTQADPSRANNSVSRPLTVNFVDLALSNFVVNTPMAPGQVTVGDGITIAVDIRNLSPLANSTSFPVNVYLSVDSVITTNDQLIGSFGSGLQLNAGTMTNLSQSFTVPTPNLVTPVGSYFIGLIADPANTQFEAITANNRVSSPLAVGSASLVDLALSNFVVTTPGQLLIGDSITISVDIFNLSKFTNSTNFPVNVYLSLDSAIDTNDQLIGSFGSGTQLNAGTMTNLSQSFTVPTPNLVTPAGSYFIGLIADPANTQLEAITANNRASSPISIDFASFVDLALSNFVVSTPATPGQVLVGDSISVSVDISNLSTRANSTSFPVSVYLSLDSAIDPNDQLIGSFTGGIQQLNAGAMTSLSQNFVIPAPNPTAPGGNYFIGLIADPANTQLESNLANNRVSSPLRFDSASFLDLAVSNFVVTTPVTPGQVLVGDTITVSVDISNLSPLRNSTSFPVNVYLSPDSTIDPNDQFIGAFTGGLQLDTGAMTSRIQSFVIPTPTSPAPGGNYFIGLIADPSNSQVDSNLANNRVSSPLTFNFVDVAVSNFVVTTPVTPGQVLVGDTITVSVDISNLSPLRNSTNFPVHVYLSLDSTITTADQLMGSFSSIIQLNAGAITSLSEDFVIPTPFVTAPGGNYFIGLIADRVNAQADLNRANNQVSSPLTFDTASFIDLALSNLVVTTPTTPGQVAIGDSLSISFDVSNLSPLTNSQFFSVDVYLSLDSTITTADQLIFSFSNSFQLNAGATTSRTQSFVIPAPTSPAPGGNYFIGVLATSPIFQFELNLANNTVSSPLSFDPASFVDLAVSNLVVTSPSTPGRVAVGDSITVSVDITNISPLVNSTIFPVSVYLSPDSTISTNDQLIGNFAGGVQLNAGAMTSLSQNFVIPTPNPLTPGGNYFIGVRANSPVLQVDLDPANNSAGSEILVAVGLQTQDYVITQSPLGFTSISATGVNQGANFSNKDEGELNIPIPFNFQFFGSNIVAGTNMLRLGANGAASFQTAVNIDFTSSSLSSSSAPNNTIFLAWDDLDFRNSGSIYTALQGTAPNRVWIIEYSMVPEFGTGTTFLDGQIAIFETSNIIEFRYSAATVFGSGTVASGLKSSTGVARGFPDIARGQPTPTSNLVFSPVSPVDLALSNFVVTTPMTPGQVAIGDTITVSVDITNLAPLGNSTSFPVNVYLSTDSIIRTNDQLIGSLGSGTQLDAGAMTNLSQSFTIPAPNSTTPGGNYFIGLIADPFNSQADVLTANNRASQPLTFNVVDLALSNFVVTTPMTPGQVAIGDSISVSVDINNLSPSVNSTNFPVNVYLSTDSIISTNDQLIGSFGNGIQLDAGAMTNLSQSFTIPNPNSTTPSGNYFIGLITDPSNSQVDSNLANNSVSSPLVFDAASFIDLALSNFVVTTPMTPGQVSVGDSISVSVDINNLSTRANSSAFVLALYLSVDSTIDTNDQIIGSFTNGNQGFQLDAGAMINLSQSFTIPNPLATTPGGNYFIGLIADPFNSQVESNLANNRVSSPLTFDSASFVDLAVSNFVVTTPTVPGQVLTGDSITISVDIRNLSSLRNSTNFQVLVYLSLNSTIDFFNDQIIGIFTGGVQLDAGAMTSRTQSFVIPTPNTTTPGGNYFVNLIADPFNTQLEVDKANNSASSSLSFPRVDLVASNLLVTTPTTPGQVAVGDSITISVDINNLSPLANSTSFPVNVYLSPDSTIDTSDQLLGSFGSGTQLNAGAMANLSQSFTLPTPSVATPGGNYFIGLIADPSNTQFEFNTANNRVSSPLSFRFVDLELSNLLVTTPTTPGQVAVGDSITVSIDINNLSTVANSTIFPVNVYLSLDSAIQPSDQLIGSFTGGAQINASGMTSLSQSFIIPTPSFPSPNGHYFLGLIADPVNTQFDTTLSNNSVVMPILVGAQFFSVNLTVSNLQVLTPQRPGNALAGDSISVSVDISNPFFVDSTNFPVNVYLSLDSTIDTNDQLIGSFTGGAQVNANGTVSLRESFILPTPNPSATSHRYRIGVIADPANTQADRGLSDNNIASTPFLIGSPYSVTSQNRGAFPTILGNANTVTLRDGATTVMDEGELLRQGGAPFDFPFFGNMIAQGTPVNIGFNGYLVIGSGGTPGGFNNPPIPSNTAPNGFIAAFWDDLVSNTSGEENTTGSLPKGKLSELVAGRAPDRTWTIEFTNFGRYQSNGTNLSFQIVIHENGVINLRYDSSSTFVGTASGFGATIGLENSTGNDGVDATGLGTNNLSFPSKDLVLFPPGGPYSVTTQARGVFPSILGMPNTVTLRDGATTVMDEGELLRQGGAPFDFPFFGNMIAQGTPVSIGFNGYLVIGSGGTSAGFENLPIPSNQAPDGFIAAFWDDLVSNTSGEANTAGNLPKGKLSELVTGSAPFRSWTIEFTNFGRFETNGSNLSFQIVIYENGVINLRYDSSSTFVGTASGFGATIGLENSTGTDGVDATGLGTGNLSFPSKDLFLSPPGAALPAPTPDLSPSSISLAQSSVSAGARIDVTRIITNSSSAAVTSSFQVSIYLSTDSTITSSDTLLGTDTIASLAAGTSASATSSFTIPSATPVGDYFVGIIVNNGPNPVTESNTTNNSLATSGTLRIDLPSKFRGDINGDNHVDISDLMACISVALAADSSSPANITLADVNGDNTVDILDIQFTISRVLGAP